MLEPERLFAVANPLALIGWLVLAVAPRWRAGATVLAPVLVAGLLALAYVALLARALPGAEGGFGSLAQVRALFEDDALLLAGWLHYLAFDLFVGSWELRDARGRGLPHVLVLPCLALTFLAGPAGYLLYLGLRALKGGRGVEAGGG